MAYAAMFAILFGGLADPVRDAGAPLPDLSNYSVEGLKAFFRSEGGLVLGWTHYLAFDLFTGLWIARDADAKGFSRLVQAPFLFGPHDRRGADGRPGVSPGRCRRARR